MYTKVESDALPKDSEILGNKKVINFNVKEVTKDIDGDSKIFYEYFQMRFNTSFSDDYISKEVLKAKKDISKRVGEVYTLNGLDYLISFMKDDADGLLQVQAGFSRGLTSTTIHFENGTKMPISVEDFEDFANWYVINRDSFFVEVV